MKKFKHMNVSLQLVKQELFDNKSIIKGFKERKPKELLSFTTIT